MIENKHYEGHERNLYVAGIGTVGCIQIHGYLYLVGVQMILQELPGDDEAQFQYFKWSTIVCGVLA